MAPQRKPATQRRPPAPVARALRSIGDDLAVWRKLRGLTQAQLADRAGVARTTLVRLERGDGAVGFENVLRVARALGILEAISRALDPYESDVGRLRSDEQLPQRVRPRALREPDDG
jgi:transcriptional regulator with XRE-family HTH domain